MAQREINLEQTDFSAGFLTDVNPLQFPPNATVEEANFEIQPDGSRARRRGLKLTANSEGVIQTPPSSFYKAVSLTSKVYSTISPNGNDGAVARQVDAVTLTDDDISSTNINVYDATQDDFPEIPISNLQGSAPFRAVAHVTYHAYTSVDISNNHQLSILYGINGTGEVVSTNKSQLFYDDLDGNTQSIGTGDARLADLASWSGRMVYAFNTNDDTYGYGIGISRLPDPGLAASTQVTALANCTSPGTEPAASDGVWIYAGDLGKIRRLVPWRTGLLVFTSDNIWYLNALTGYFDPYSFSFDKISSTRIQGNDSIVTYNNNVFMWAEDGIYVVFPDENTGLPKLESITANKIQKFYESLLPATKQFSKGVFNKESNQVRWLFNTNAADLNEAATYRFTDELILDLTRGSFTLNMYNQSEETFIIDYIPDRAATENFTGAEIVTVSGEVITTSLGEVLVAEYLSKFSVDSSFKYVVRDQQVGVNTQARTASISDLSFLDYVGSEGFPEGTDATAFIKSGYITLQDSQRRKTANYVTTTLERTETGYDDETGGLIGASGCFLTSYWDFADEEFKAKVSGPYQVYRLNRLYLPDGTTFKYGQDYITTKNKIRGRGRTLQFKFESEPGKNCRLYSWGFNGEILTKV